MPIILASASPRRRELLAQIDIDCEVSPANIDETVRDAESAIAYTQRLARSKARACQLTAALGRVILAADTVVVLNGDILGKPRDKIHALEMLARLSGRTHQVITAFTVLRDEHEYSAYCTTTVTMVETDAAQREAYWQTGEPNDKAGAYAIQGRGAVFVDRIEGSYSNVVGLPLREVALALQSVGVSALKTEQ